MNFYCNLFIALNFRTKRVGARLAFGISCQIVKSNEVE